MYYDRITMQLNIESSSMHLHVLRPVHHSMRVCRSDPNSSLIAVLLRTRLWKYLFLTYMKQMYCQILANPDDRDYQRILWRYITKSLIEKYWLWTVTYGTSIAPFQALCTLRELARQDGYKWPLAAATLLNDTFVDDIFTGTNTEEVTLECQWQLIHLHLCV